MTREVARRLIFLFKRASPAAAAVVVAGILAPACYSGGGGGTAPLTTTFYFPVGMAVSAGGNALYVVNSDYDLQFNGGTLQSYDLFSIRADTAALIAANFARLPPSAVDDRNGGPVPFVSAGSTFPCAIGGVSDLVDAGTPSLHNSAGSRILLGQDCAPPVDTAKYQHDSVVLGAFATDLQLQTKNGAVGHRLFTPVSGDATLTWADVGIDDPTLAPSEKDPSIVASGTSMLSTDIFTLTCTTETGAGRSCDARHRTGNNASDVNDTRQLTLPGEPVAMAQTEDGTAITVAHQSETDTSLLLAGDPDKNVDPSMQFVVTDVDNGGKGIAAIPHDKDAPRPPCETVNDTPPCVRPAFLETNGTVAELDLLRYYDDDGSMIGGPPTPSSLKRPYLEKEAVFPFATNLDGLDSRGIAIDATQRLACKATGLLPAQSCGELPARVFFANRTPPTLVLATIGGTAANGGGQFDPDLMTFGTSSIPLPPGPSRVYLAPIVNLKHQYELRVFVVNFDSSTISIYDPSQPNLALVDTIYVGPGPFAMAFDPFSMTDVAKNSSVPADTRYAANLNLNMTYRFAYVASFTQSFVQVIDLDQTQPTFENVVFTLGTPTAPKGT